MMDINVGLLQWSIKFLIKKLLVVVLKTKISQTKNQLKNYTNQLLQKCEKRKVQLPFIDNILGADLAYVQLMSKFNKGICFLLCVIDTFSIYEWDISLKDKRVNKTTDAFQKILDESNRKIKVANFIICQ